MAQANRVIEILKPGRYPNAGGKMVELSERTLEQIAVSYDTKVHSAPVVVGHPEHDSPQFGSVAGLQVRDGVLLAELENLAEELVGAVREGRFTKVSAALYGPETPTNPKPGGYSLRHVGVLGGTPPVVKGLASIKLSEMGAEGIETAINMPGSGFYPGGLNEPTPTPGEVQGREDNSRELSLAEREKKLEQAHRERIKALEDRERALSRSEALAFAETMADSGQIPPGAVAPLAEVIATLDRAAPIEFAEHGGKVHKKLSGAAWLREFIEQGQRRVPYGETNADGVFNPTNVNLGEKGQLLPTDPRRQALHEEALRLAEKEEITYIEAVRKLGG